MPETIELFDTKEPLQSMLEAYWFVYKCNDTLRQLGETDEQIHADDASQNKEVH
jgi:hypothetical protein